MCNKVTARSKRCNFTFLELELCLDGIRELASEASDSGTWRAPLYLGIERSLVTGSQFDLLLLHLLPLHHPSPGGHLASQEGGDGVLVVQQVSGAGGPVDKLPYELSPGTTGVYSYKCGEGTL